MRVLRFGLCMLLACALLIALPVTIGTLITTPASAHPGGTDSSGCHTCRTNCTEKYGIPYGDYHCHNGGSTSGGSGSSSAPPPPPRDTTPPAPPTHTGFAFDDFNGIAKATVTAERGSRIVAWSSLAGIVYEGEGTGAPLPIEFRVPEGTHTVTFTATDAAGNASAASAPLTVTNPPLTAPLMRLGSKPGRLPVIVNVTGKANAAVNFAGAPVPLASLTLSGTGSGSATLSSLPDGQYDLTGSFSDGQGRTSPPGTLRVLVDTTPPDLDITIDKKAAKQGRVKYVIETEPGAEVTVRGTRALKRNYTAGSAPIKRAVSVEDGRYKLTITAADETGNKTTEKLAVNVSS